VSVEVVTFGCRLNTFESEVIKREASAVGLADTIVVNSCAVTAEAVRQAKAGGFLMDGPDPGSMRLTQSALSWVDGQRSAPDDESD